MLVLNLFIYSTADFTLIWNALDYPALIIPVTKVDPALDKVKPPHQFLSDEDKANHEFCEFGSTKLYINHAKHAFKITRRLSKTHQSVFRSSAERVKRKL